MNGDPHIPIRTPAIRARILLMMGHGTPKTVAAQAVGVSKPAFIKWRKDDLEFEEEIRKVEAEWLDSLVSRAFDFIKDEKHGANMTQWLLERRGFQWFASRKERTYGTLGDPDDLDSSTPDLETAEHAHAALHSIASLLVAAGMAEDVGEARTADIQVHPEGPLDADVEESGRAGADGHTNGVPVTTTS